MNVLVTLSLSVSWDSTSYSLIAYTQSSTHFVRFFKVKLCKEIGHIDKTVPFHCAVNKLSWLINYIFQFFNTKAKSIAQKNPNDWRCGVCWYLLIRARVWWLGLMSRNITQWSPWPVGALSRARPAERRLSVASLLTSADPMFTISQSLTPVSSHPLRPEAHYAGPGLAFPRYCALAPYICTVYYVCNVCNGVGPRAASGRPQ